VPFVCVDTIGQNDDGDDDDDDDAGCCCDFCETVVAIVVSKKTKKKKRPKKLSTTAMMMMIPKLSRMMLSSSSTLPSGTTIAPWDRPYRREPSSSWHPRIGSVGLEICPAPSRVRIAAWDNTGRRAWRRRIPNTWE